MHNLSSLEADDVAKIIETAVQNKLTQITHGAQ
jgi:hypothetical protein